MGFSGWEFKGRFIHIILGFKPFEHILISAVNLKIRKATIHNYIIARMFG